MKKTLLKYGKEFLGYDCHNGKLLVNYMEKRTLKTAYIDDNSIFNVREIRLLKQHFDNCLTLINKVQ